MRRSAVALAMAAGLFGASILSSPAVHAQERCGRVVVVTLPGVTWTDIEERQPPAILEAAAAGATGSMSVRTIVSRTTYASGFGTMGAGARVDAGDLVGASDRLTSEKDLTSERVPGVEVLKELAEAAGYGAQPGALGEASEGTVAAIGNGDLGRPPATPLGPGRWVLLAAMDRDGQVDDAAVGPNLLEQDPDSVWGVRTNMSVLGDAVDAALSRPCSATFIDQGDLVRAEQGALAEGRERGPEWDEALAAADATIALASEQLDPQRDLLLIVSPTSPATEDDTHLGVAIAVGDAFPAGSTMESASTRRRGIVTLPDVAPTVLAHLGRDRPTSMTGRPWIAVEPAQDDLVGAAIDLDREAVLIEDLQPPVSKLFVAAQVLVYLLIGFLLFRRERDENALVGSRLWHWLSLAALAVVAFPVCTYLAGAIDAHDLGGPAYVAIMLGIDVVLVALTVRLLDSSMDRLLALTALTTLVLYADLVSGARLQLNTVFGYSPIIAGRFAGAGNIVFAVLGAATLLTGVLIIHRWPRSRYAYYGVALLYLMTVVVDGAPQFGSDVGGVIALVPAFAITFLLLIGRRPTWKILVGGLVAGLLMLGIFLAVDLARPPEQQTHLARLAQDIGDRGGGILYDTLERKARANLRVFRTSIWTFFVPPAVAVMVWLLRRPRGRWQRLAEVYPRLRAGLLGGLVLAILGFAVNDSGIVIPAMVLSFLVPMALITHLSLEGADGGETT
ncbi:MAG: hypothetical protein ACR2LG_10395 [Actinomycetota bacterium]|nr:hypothetical protein [Actinomycetota bacterium]